MANLDLVRRSYRVAMATLAAGSLCLAVAAPASASAKHSTHAAHATKTVGNAKSHIIKNWETFFSAKTSLKQRVALLQYGRQFAKVMAAQSKNPMAQSSTAKVSSVKVARDKAFVTYTVYVAGEPALKNQKGEAFLLGGKWKVGAKSFCGLLALEGSAKSVRACHG